MAKVACPSFEPLDLVDHCKPWDEDLDGADRPMKNRAKVLRALREGVRHCQGRQPRMLACQPHSLANAPDTTSDPIYRFHYRDDWPNGRRSRWDVCWMPHDYSAGGSSSAAHYYCVESDSSEKSADSWADSGVYPEAAYYETFHHDRGASPDAEATEGISGKGDDRRLIDFYVADDPLEQLDTELHSVALGEAQAGDPITSGQLEEIRTALHELWNDNAPVVFCWLGHADGDAFQETSSGSQCLSTTSSTYVNVFDSSVTSRTATSPGFPIHLYKAARGIRDNIKVRFWVFGRTDGSAGNNWVRWDGPDHIANNWSAVEVTTSAGWFGTVGTACYLDASAANNDTTTGRNKIDVSFKTDSSIYIWGLIGQVVYE